MTYQRPCAPSPGERPQHPWRFRLGAELYLCTWGDDGTFKVIGGEIVNGMPHYHVLTPSGEVWVMPQIHFLSRPRTNKER